MDLILLGLDYCTVHASPVIFKVRQGYVPGVLSCPTSDDVKIDYVCTLPTSTRINRPPCLDHHAHAP